MEKNGVPRDVFLRKLDQKRKDEKHLKCRKETICPNDKFQALHGKKTELCFSQVLKKLNFFLFTQYLNAHSLTSYIFDSLDLILVIN